MGRLRTASKMRRIPLDVWDIVDNVIEAYRKHGVVDIHEFKGANQTGFVWDIMTGELIGTCKEIPIVARPAPQVVAPAPQVVAPAPQVVAPAPVPVPAMQLHLVYVDEVDPDQSVVLKPIEGCSTVEELITAHQMGHMINVDTMTFCNRKVKGELR